MHKDVMNELSKGWRQSFKKMFEPSPLTEMLRKVKPVPEPFTSGGCGGHVKFTSGGGGGQGNL